MTIVSSGQVLSGGSYASLTVQSGGSAVGVTGLGTITVLSGGSVTNTTVASGFLTVESGGSDTGTTVLPSAKFPNGSYDQIAGGSSFGAIVQSNSYLQLFNSGLASGSVIQSGGLLQIYTGSVVAPVLQTGATVVFTGSGALIAALVQSGVNITLSSGGQLVSPVLAIGASITFPALPYAPGETATLYPPTGVVTISSGGRTLQSFQLGGSYAGDAFVTTPFSSGSGTVLTVYPASQVSSGMVATLGSGQVLSGGTVGNLTVMSGARAVGFNQPSGTVSVQSGGSVSYATISGGLVVASGGTVSNDAIVSGTEVLSGGVATSETIFSGATLQVTNGGQASSTFLRYGAAIQVVDGTLAGFSVPDGVVMAGGVTLANPPQSIQVTSNGPGGFATVSAGAGTTAIGTQTSATLPGAGLFTVLPAGGSVVPVPTQTPQQTALLQAILALGPAATSQTVYQPGQGGTPSSMTLGAQVLLDLPEYADTITGNAAIPLADIVLDNPGATYVTGATAASFVVAADNAPATIVDNRAADTLVAATGAGADTLAGLAGVNQFTTGLGGSDTVLLDGAANTLVSDGTDAVLVGGPSQVQAFGTGLDAIALTAGTTLTFINQTTPVYTSQSAGPAADSIEGAAGSTIVIAGPGAAVIGANGGTEGFVVDTSAGNTTLNGAPGGGDAFLFVKDANAGSARDSVYNFGGTDTLGLHGYAGFYVQVVAGGAMLALSDGSQVTFAGATVAAIQQAIKVV